MVECLSPTGLLPDEYTPLADQIAKNALNQGNIVAFVSADTGEGITWKELSKWIGRLAVFLGGHGIQANDRLVVLGKNSLEHLILYYGIQAYGATYCTINTDINKNHLSNII